MKIGVVGALAAGLMSAATVANGRDLGVKAEESRRSGRTRSRIPGKPGVAGNKLSKKAERGTLTLPRGRRGLMGNLGRVVA